MSLREVHPLCRKQNFHAVSSRVHSDTLKLSIFFIALKEGKENWVFEKPESQSKQEPERCMGIFSTIMPIIWSISQFNNIKLQVVSLVKIHWKTIFTKCYFKELFFFFFWSKLVSFSNYKPRIKNSHDSKF